MLKGLKKEKERGGKREREIQRERETEKRVCVSMDLVNWKENCLFNTLIMQNLYIINQGTDLPNSFLYLNNS